MWHRAGGALLSGGSGSASLVEMSQSTHIKTYLLCEW